MESLTNNERKIIAKYGTIVIKKCGKAKSEMKIKHLK